MSKEEQLNILKLMAKHEEALGELYGEYQKKFPEHSSFWEGFSSEEKTHTKWIRDFIQKVENGEAEIKPDRFQPKSTAKSIANSVEYVKSLKKDAMEDDMSYLDQLDAGFVMERGLLINKYFESAGDDDPQLKELLKKLHAATVVHEDRISKELHEVRESEKNG